MLPHLSLWMARDDHVFHSCKICKQTYIIAQKYAHHLTGDTGFTSCYFSACLSMASFLQRFEDTRGYQIQIQIQIILLHYNVLHSQTEFDLDGVAVSLVTLRWRCSSEERSVT